MQNEHLDPADADIQLEAAVTNTKKEFFIETKVKGIDEVPLT